MFKYLFVLLVLIFPLGQIGRTNVFETGIIFHPLDAFLILGLILLIAYRRKYLSEFWRQHRLRWPVILFMAAITFSLVVNLPRLGWENTFIAALYPVRWLLCFGVYLCVAGLSASEKGKLRKWLVVPVLLVALTGLAQYLLLPDVSFLQADGWDDHYFRVIGTFLDPGFTGIILVVGLVFVFLDVKKDWMKYMSMVITYLALALTYSRASFLAFVTAFGVIAFLKKDIKIFIAAVVVMLFTLVLLPKTFGEGTKLGRENSVTARINNWKNSIAIWSEAPIFGIGYNTYRFSLADKKFADPEQIRTSHGSSGADSSLLLILATSGIVGLAAYSFVITKSVQLSTKNVLFMASMAAVLIHSWFNNTLLYPWVMVWLWTLLALS